MKQEEKELLLNDLCARLPYNVKIVDELGRCRYLTLGDTELVDLYYSDVSGVEPTIKPYLRPLPSMTEEEKEEYCKLQDEVLYSSGRPVTDNINDMVDWLNAHHFDYRRTKDGKTMIEAGLALEAPVDMYNENK